MTSQNESNTQEELRRLGLKTLREAVEEWTGEPWPEAALKDETVTRDDVIGLQNTLEEAKDEKPLQEYLTKHPALLSTVGFGVEAKWVFPKLKLGEQFVPDFAVVDVRSSGYKWYLMELESPVARVLTRVGGEPSKEYRHAKQQIDDWRIWLRANVAYSKERKYYGLDDTFMGIIVMGRRSELNISLRDRYRELSIANPTVMSYDRLLEFASEKAGWKPKS